eukprot:5691778-Pleurochrysis_carterae.AAC.1
MTTLITSSLTPPAPLIHHPLIPSANSHQIPSEVPPKSTTKLVPESFSSPPNRFFRARSAAVHCLFRLHRELRERGVVLVFATVGNRVDRTLRRAGFVDEVGQ